MGRLEREQTEQDELEEVRVQDGFEPAVFKAFGCVYSPYVKCRIVFDGRKTIFRFEKDRTCVFLETELQDELKELLGMYDLKRNRYKLDRYVDNVLGTLRQRIIQVNGAMAEDNTVFVGNNVAVSEGYLDSCAIEAIDVTLNKKAFVGSMLETDTNAAICAETVFGIVSHKLAEAVGEYSQLLINWELGKACKRYAVYLSHEGDCNVVATATKNTVCALYTDFSEVTKALDDIFFHIRQSYTDDKQFAYKTLIQAMAEKDFITSQPCAKNVAPLITRLYDAYVKVITDVQAKLTKFMKHGDYCDILYTHMPFTNPNESAVKNAATDFCVCSAIPRRLTEKIDRLAFESVINEFWSDSRWNKEHSGSDNDSDSCNA